MTLLMRDLENQEKGREEGLAKGREEGIQGMVAALKELNISTQIIINKLQEIFHLSSEDAQKYV